MPEVENHPSGEEARVLLQKQRALEFVLNIGEELERRHSGRVRFEDNSLLAVAELVSDYIARSLVPDLVAFARHAKRQRILATDVLLCARRNLDLVRDLEEELQRADRAHDVEQASEAPADGSLHPDVGLF
jgi:histone H3/H4